MLVTIRDFHTKEWFGVVIPHDQIMRALATSTLNNIINLNMDGFEIHDFGDWYVSYNYEATYPSSGYQLFFEKEIDAIVAKMLLS